MDAVFFHSQWASTMQIVFSTVFVSCLACIILSNPMKSCIQQHAIYWLKKAVHITLRCMQYHNCKCRSLPRFVPIHEWEDLEKWLFDIKGTPHHTALWYSDFSSKKLRNIIFAFIENMTWTHGNPFKYKNRKCHLLYDILFPAKAVYATVTNEEFSTVYRYKNAGNAYFDTALNTDITSPLALLSLISPMVMLT